MRAEYKGNRAHASSSSFRNALEFMVENCIKNTVNTALLVRVEQVEPSSAKSKSGRLTCKPLVNQYDSRGNILEMSQIFDIPYMRYQGGVAAIVCDPCVGDIGLAIFAQQDISLVGENELLSQVQPASFRSYDLADGLYIGGFLNQAPEIWLELTQDGQATLHAPTKIVIEAKDIELIAENNISMTAKSVNIQAVDSFEMASSQTNIESIVAITGDTSIKGAVTVNGETKIVGSTTVTGATTIHGLATINGLTTITPDAIIASISFVNHKHGNVVNGQSKTSIAEV